MRFFYYAKNPLRIEIKKFDEAITIANNKI